MNAVRCYLHDNDFSQFSLLTQDPTGQRFLKYFHHGWSFIEADMPPWGERPQWRTETRYPLQPRNLWSKYLDDQTMLGLSFSSQTNYMLLDIDRSGANHPFNNRRRFDGILEAMENIGLCRPIAICSSESEGIHLYYFLPQAVHSFTLAATVRHALEQSGYKARAGQLEIFPNPKPYNVGKPTSFKSHRLPLQRGSYLLDWDLQPSTNSITTLLQQAESTAAGQDHETLLAAMEEVCHAQKKEYYRGKGKVQEWYDHLQEQIKEGFSGYGQTNTLLLSIACFGIVFRKLGGDELYEYVLDSIINSPNYYQYCRHQDEIEQRVAAVVRSAQQYYYPYAGKPPRDVSYQEHFGANEEEKQHKVIIFPHPSQKRHEQTFERVKTVIALLKSAGEFPATTFQRTQAIIAKSQEAFGVGVSQTTLHKPKYLPLWHPAHEQIEETALTKERVNSDSSVLKYPILPSPWDLDPPASKPFPVSLLYYLHVLTLYEGCCVSFWAPIFNTLEQSDVQNLVLNPYRIKFLFFSSFSYKVFLFFFFTFFIDKKILYTLFPLACSKKPPFSDKNLLSHEETCIDTALHSLFTTIFPFDIILNSYISDYEILLFLSFSVLCYYVILKSQFIVKVFFVKDIIDSKDNFYYFDDMFMDSGILFFLETREYKKRIIENIYIFPIYLFEKNWELSYVNFPAIFRLKNWGLTRFKINILHLKSFRPEQLEQYINYYLMQCSSCLISQEENVYWFDVYLNIRSEMEVLRLLWIYIQNLQ